MDGGGLEQNVINVLHPSDQASTAKHAAESFCYLCYSLKQLCDWPDEDMWLSVSEHGSAHCMESSTPSVNITETGATSLQKNSASVGLSAIELIFSISC